MQQLEQFSETFIGPPLFCLDIK